MIKSSNTVYHGYHRLDEITIEENGETYKREVLIRENSVAALVYNTEKDKYVFVKQFRPGSKDYVVETVAGTLDTPDEAPESALQRELLEETGYKPDRYKYLCEFYASPGYSSEMLTLFYVEVSHQAEAGGGLDDENENIEIVHLTPEAFQKYNFIDAKSLIAQLYFLQGFASFK